jgi:prepilin-type N-terminal cleavage/methylation domain-containing protein
MKSKIFFRKQKSSRNSCKKGFSLVELVVIIAILAVLAAVAAPFLLNYVEKSRADKDYSTMDEVTNSILLTLSDQRGYDEALQHSITDNVSCYIDRGTESGYNKIITNVGENDNTRDEYKFGDETRTKDETPFSAAGNMRGVTITFEPTKDQSASYYIFKDGVINKFVQSARSSFDTTSYLYSNVKSTIGEKLELTSATYKNSEYTIFIRLGTSGGADESKADAVEVYGQFSGTNLSSASTVYVSTIDRCADTLDEIDKIFTGGSGTSQYNPEDLVGAGSFYPDKDIISIDELKEKHSLSYYSSVYLAVKDGNAGTLGENADATEDTAVACLYRYASMAHVVLLKDTTENQKICPDTNMVINLGGHKLTTTAGIAIDGYSGNLTIDGRLEGSMIESKSATSAVRMIQMRSGTLTVNGGTYIGYAACPDTINVGILSAASNTVINGVTIEIESPNTQAEGIQIHPDKTFTITHCNVKASTKGPTSSYGIKLTARTKGTISNCRVVAHSNYTNDAYGSGILGFCTSLTVNDCYVYGVQCGITSYCNNIKVTGGTYDGYGNGGIGIATSSSYQQSNASIKDATLRQGQMPMGYKNTWGSWLTGLFIVGEVSNQKNCVVYVDNCDIVSNSLPIVMHLNESSLYISNSRIVGNTIRIDSDKSTLHIGQGNNFGIENIPASNRSQVTITNEKYRK